MARTEDVGAVTGPETSALTTRLTLPEVAYLLHVAGSAGDSLAKERLLLVAEPEDDVLRAGLSSLYAHGGAVVENDRIVINGAQRVIAAVLSGATRWIEVGVNVGGRRDVVHVVEGSGVVCLINRLPFGVLELAAARPGSGIAEAALGLAASFASSGQLSHIAVNAVGCGGSTPSMQAVRTADGWDVTASPLRTRSLPASSRRWSPQERTQGQPGPLWGAENSVTCFPWRPSSLAAPFRPEWGLGSDGRDGWC